MAEEVNIGEGVHPETSQDTESVDTQSQTKPGDPLEGNEELQKTLYSLYIKCVSEDRYPRLVEVKDVKQAEFYWGGRQYVWWSTQDK